MDYVKPADVASAMLDSVRHKLEHPPMDISFVLPVSAI